MRKSNLFNIFFLQLLLYSACNFLERETVVIWEKDPYEYEPYHQLYKDTLGKAPYSNPALPLINNLDSILRTFKFEELESIENRHLKGYEFGNYQATEIAFNGEITKIIRVNIYQEDWLWNQVCIYSDKFGVIACYPVHTYSKYFLRKKIVNGKIEFELDDEAMKFISTDSIINPIPPFPKEVPDIMEAI